MLLRALVSQLTEQFAQAGIEAPNVEAEVLIAEVLGINRGQLGAQIITEGVARAPNRSMYYALGYQADDFSKPLPGLNDFPEQDRPPVMVPFISYHLMAGIGGGGIVSAAAGTVMFFRFGRRGAGLIFRRRCVIWRGWRASMFLMRSSRGR